MKLDSIMLSELSQMEKVSHDFVNGTVKKQTRNQRKKKHMDAEDRKAVTREGKHKWLKRGDYMVRDGN